MIRSRTVPKWILLILLIYMTVDAQTVRYNPGSGMQVASQNPAWKFRVLGYVQSTFTFHQIHQNESVQNAFFVRRARVDLIFDFLDRYQVFFEFDGRGSRTELVLAQMDIKFSKNHSVRFGKFITPFSPENTRSSRGLSTVERYSALNSMFLLPALDTQYGLMFLGQLRNFNYYLSVTNGNGKASANIKENNNSKDVQLHLETDISKKFSLGVSFNYTEENSQTLQLVDHTFAPFNRAAINGGRVGYLLNFEYKHHKKLFRGEVFQYHFRRKASIRQQVKTFNGGYLEAGRFLTGDKQNGFQLVGRTELAQYGELHSSLAGPACLASFILGNNWYRDGVFRLQVNLVFELADKKSVLAGSRFFRKQQAFEILTMLQIKI